MQKVHKSGRRRECGSGACYSLLKVGTAVSSLCAMLGLPLVATGPALGQSHSPGQQQCAPCSAGTGDTLGFRSAQAFRSAAHPMAEVPVLCVGAHVQVLVSPNHHIKTLQ